MTTVGPAKDNPMPQPQTAIDRTDTNPAPGPLLSVKDGGFSPTAGNEYPKKLRMLRLSRCHDKMWPKLFCSALCAW